MINISDNPWVERFIPLLNRDEIRRRARVAAQPVSGLEALPIEVASGQLNEALSQIFVPTNRCCEILQRFVEIAIGHCLKFYPSRKAFMETCYSTKYPTCSRSPICLTGPGGSGKSHIIHALTRIFGTNSTIQLSPDDSEFPLIPSWDIRVEKRTSVEVLLNRLVPSHQKGDLKEYRRHAFQSGIALLTIDELQFLTQSSQANTLVAQHLLQLSQLQLPLVYVTNYSLCHRLLRRPQEEVQRLMADPMVILPESPYSDDWRAYLNECKVAGSQYLDINPEECGEMLHSYSAGLKRLVRILLTIAYQIARGDGRHAVTLADVELAYRSTTYSPHRKDVEIMIKQWITGRCIRADLWCPFDLPSSDTKQFTEYAKALRDQAVADELLKSSMTAKERKAYGILRNKVSSKPTRKQTAEVIDLEILNKSTASELLKNAQAFKDIHLNDSNTR